MASGGKRVQAGSFKGTGSSISIRTVGFRPTQVKLFNVSGLCTAEWSESMADASAVKTITAGTISFITSGGITPLSDGFSIGADTDINVSTEVVHWVCVE
jgi:hypothetical protein